MTTDREVIRMLCSCEILFYIQQENKRDELMGRRDNEIFIHTPASRAIFVTIILHHLQSKQRHLNVINIRDSSRTIGISSDYPWRRPDNAM